MNLDRWKRGQDLMERNRLAWAQRAMNILFRFHEEVESGKLIYATFLFFEIQPSRFPYRKLYLTAYPKSDNRLCEFSLTATEEDSLLEVDYRCSNPTKLEEKLNSLGVFEGLPF